MHKSIMKPFECVYCPYPNEMPVWFKGEVVNETEDTYTIKYYNLYSDGGKWAEQVYDKSKIKVMKLS